MQVSSNESAAGIATLSISRNAAKRAHIRMGRGASVVIGRGTISGINAGTSRPAPAAVASHRNEARPRRPHGADDPPGARRRWRRSPRDRRRWALLSRPAVVEIPTAQ